MKFVCELSFAVRLAGLAFVVGLIAGLVLGFQAAAGPTESGRTPASAVPVLVSEFPWSPPMS